MNEENQIKTVVLLGITNIMIQYIEDISFDHPNLIRYGLKKSLKNAVSEIEKQHERIFMGLEGEQRIGVAEQINDISLKFHDWVFNEFKFDNNK